MDLSELIITRSEELEINQKMISERTYEPECADAGGRRLPPPHINQLWRNKPPMRRVPEPPTVAALAYALKCTKVEIYVAALYTIGALQAQGPDGIRILVVGTNGFSPDQMRRIVHAGESAIATEIDQLTRMEQHGRA